MKKILITGAGSYIGTTFEAYLKERFPDGYEVATVDMLDDAWRDADFSPYDAVFHVAGIAHSDTKRVTEEEKQLYYRVNTDLTFETAQKAKDQGVSQFIFMSSAIVYGNSAPIGKSKMITKETVPEPANFYGDSKLQAEKRLMPLDDNAFKVVILRPPMIYGKGSRGNYPLLAKMAKKLPFFPLVHNERSMLYVENLCEFVRLLVEYEERGIFWPQNQTYSNTSEMVRMIGRAHGKKVRLVKGFTPLLKMLSHGTELVNKAFGNFTYDHEISEYKLPYCRYSLMESIDETEKK